MRRLSMLLIAVCLSLSARIPVFGGQASQPSDFDRYRQLAQSAPTRDAAVAYLRKALEARPGNPGNVVTEFEIANKLSQETDTPGSIEELRREEALPVYESIVKNYDYDSYYEKVSGQTFWVGQNLIVQSAIRAGDIHAFVLNNEKYREYEHMAMELLKRTYDRRKQEWLNEPEPVPRQVPEIPTTFGGTPEGIKGLNERMLGEWRQRKERAAKGDVFCSYEMLNARIAVDYYAASFGRQTPEEVLIPMGLVAKEFAGTPMAEYALSRMEEARKTAAAGFGKLLTSSDALLDSTLQSSDAPVLDGRTFESTVGQPAGAEDGHVETRGLAYAAGAAMVLAIAAALVILRRILLR